MLTEQPEVAKEDMKEGCEQIQDLVLNKVGDPSPNNQVNLPPNESVVPSPKEQATLNPNESSNSNPDNQAILHPNEASI